MTEQAVPRLAPLAILPNGEAVRPEEVSRVLIETAASLVEEAVSIGDLVRIMEFRKGAANLVEITLPDDTPWGGRPVRKLELPRDAALVTILRGNRVIVPEPDEPLEGGDELLLVAAAEVEDELRAILLPTV